MPAMKLVLYATGFGLVVATVLSRVKSAEWWIRFVDFPRLQIAVGLAAVVGAFAFYADPAAPLDVVFVVALLASLAYQAHRIYPYTPLARIGVLDSSPGGDDRRIRILVANVLMGNRRFDDLASLIREHDPDLILAMETDGWWDERLHVLDADYPHTVRRPQDNQYGLHLFSKLPFDAADVRCRVEDDVPSVRAQLRLRSGDIVDFHGIHPRPPRPGQDTEERDAELLIVGREVRADPRPAIVAGDLNDVAWSRTTQLFQKISGLLDPRRGRGMYSTFHADYPPLRWPLDHVFHDASFTLVGLRRLRHIGSDHFPVLVELKYEPRAEVSQQPLEVERSDFVDARDRITDADGIDRVPPVHPRGPARRDGPAARFPL